MAALHSQQPTGDRQPGAGILPSEQYVTRAMPHILSNTDITATLLIILFFITNDANAMAGGPASLTFWLIGGFAFLFPCALVTAQLATLYPSEGSVYTWTHRAFGRYMSFFAGFCAWIPGPLLMVTAADLVVTYVQNLNPNWLTACWQQGLAIIVIIAFTGLLATQGQRLVQNLVNMTAGILLLVAALIGIAALVWQAKGHASATNFSIPGNWLPTSNTAGSGLFGIITMAYLGINLAVNTGGELSQKLVEHPRRIRRSLLWGALLVIACYLLSTAAVLFVQGSHTPHNSFAIVQTVSIALGPAWGTIVTIGLLTVFTVATLVYNATFARYLLVAGIDRRLPRRMGMLNRHRVPGAAIIFQSIGAIIVATLLFIVIPSLGLANVNPLNLAQDALYVGIATAILTWALSTLFLFVDLIQVYRRNPLLLHQQRICPVPLLLFCSFVGIITGILAMSDMVLNSWTPLLSNTQWTYLVIVPTAFLILVGIITALFDTTDAINTEK